MATGVDFENSSTSAHGERERERKRWAVILNKSIRDQPMKRQQMDDGIMFGKNVAITSQVATDCANLLQNSMTENGQHQFLFDI